MRNVFLRETAGFNEDMTAAVLKDMLRLV